MPIHNPGLRSEWTDFQAGCINLGLRIRNHGSLREAVFPVQYELSLTISSRLIEKLTKRVANLMCTIYISKIEKETSDIQKTLKENV